MLEQLVIGSIASGLAGYWINKGFDSLYFKLTDKKYKTEDEIKKHIGTLLRKENPTKNELRVLDEVLRTLVEEQSRIQKRILTCSITQIKRLREQGNEISTVLHVVKDIKEWQKQFGRHPEIMKLYGALETLELQQERIVALIEEKLSEERLYGIIIDAFEKGEERKEKSFKIIPTERECEFIKVEKCAQMVGKWDVTEDRIKYMEPDNPLLNPHGLALFQHNLVNGIIRANIKFISQMNSCARIVIGYDLKTKEYYSIGIGGYNYFYVIDKYYPDIKWNGLDVAGRNEKVILGKDYAVEINVHSKNIMLIIDEIPIFHYQLPEPLKVNQTGLFAWGTGEIEFSEIHIIHNQS